MPTKKRRYSIPSDRQLPPLRLSSKSRRTAYVDTTDSDDENTHKSRSIVRHGLRARRNCTRTEDSEGSYLDEPEDEDGDDDDYESDDLDPAAEMDEAQTDESSRDVDEDVSPVVDFKIHPNSLLFLKDLKVNNNQAWLKGNRDTNPISNR
ncbi:Zinc finger protein [Fusarium oxysporum f. sp. albedinis]|nr:Zinc finger protein [Fusarium oxysporum f. sp. albedinis]